MNKYGELYRDGRVVVFTDGASRANQWRSLRHAGVGAFWGHNHPFNVSEALAGNEQTNNRAELQAVVDVLRVEARPVEVRSESSHVVDGWGQYFDNANL